MYMCLCVYDSHSLFIHLLGDGHLSRFHMLAIANNAAINIAVQISFQVSVFIFFR